MHYNMIWARTPTWFGMGIEEIDDIISWQWFSTFACCFYGCTICPRAYAHILSHLERHIKHDPMMLDYINQEVAVLKVLYMSWFILPCAPSARFCHLFFSMSFTKYVSNKQMTLVEFSDIEIPIPHALPFSCFTSDKTIDKDRAEEHTNLEVPTEAQ